MIEIPNKFLPTVKYTDDEWSNLTSDEMSAELVRLGKEWERIKALPDYVPPPPPPKPIWMKARVRCSTDNVWSYTYAGYSGYGATCEEAHTNWNCKSPYAQKPPWFDQRIFDARMAEITKPWDPNEAYKWDY
jgi:hypothetical protein